MSADEPTPIPGAEPVPSTEAPAPPAAPTSERTPATAPEGKAAEGAWRYALVVEDSPPLRRMLVKILSTQQVHAVEAGNGREALDALAEHGQDKFTLILCDLMMPVMDGPGFIVAARKIYNDTMPPILICSSRSDREAVSLVMKMGVAGYILKPFKTETVINKVREHLASLSDQ